jgi:hypothetical protein
MPKSTSFLDKEYISIPKQTEKKYLQTFVRSTIAKYQVRATGFTVRNENGQPLPVISLEKNMQGKLSLVLKFVYNKKVFTMQTGAQARR